MTASELRHLSRPFDPKMWAKARLIAESYRVVIEPNAELKYFGRTLEMPLVMADGPTPGDCYDQVLEATTGAVATLLELGERAPAPASEGRRDQQVNLRLTAEERMRLDAAASREGYRSLSDYVRAAALNRAG